MQKKSTIFDGFLKLEAWDAGMPHDTLVVRTTDSITGLLYDRTNQRVLLVKQKRAPMVREDNLSGYIVEGVAGRFDHKTSPKALLVKEAMEEAGVTLSEDDVILLNDGQPLAISPGVLTERCYLAYAEIDVKKLADGEQFGNADEGESTARVWVDIQEFIDGNHSDLRLWAFAQYLRSRRML